MVSAKAFPGWMVRWITAALLAIFLLFVSQSSITARAEVSAWHALQEAIEQAGDGEVITLSEDLTALETDSAITIPEGKRLTLDLNGHVLDSSMEPNQTEHNRRVINIRAGAILTLRDSGGTGVLTGGFHSDGGGILNRGTLIMEGGCVTGNTALHAGGGIANYGTMVLTGGSVTGNTALREGSDIFNEAKGHLTIGGDAVFDSGEAKRGGIRNEGTLTVIDAQSGEVRMEDMPVLKLFIAVSSILPVAVLLFALLLTVWLDAYLSRERRRAMVMIIMLVFILLLQNYWDNRLSLEQAYNALRIPLSVLGYVLRPVILVMFLYIVKPDGCYRAAWALIGVNAAVYMTAFFSDIAFHFTANGHFSSGPLRNTCTLISAVLYAWLFFLTMRQFRPRVRKESWIPILVTALIDGAVALDYIDIFNDQPVSFVTMAIAVSSVFYYIWLHLQFVREHEDAMQAEQRIQIMMTQIKPHFLYNALGAIEELCSSDPRKAKETTEKFSQYLRGNMDSISQTKPIPFEKELAHTKLYLDMEQMRFGDDLQVRFGIDCTAFFIPALTLEPIVENAVRHGVRENPDGKGTVTILSQDAGDHYAVTVMDDGPGFDPDKPQDGKTHIGISNVRDRLERMCAGKIHIQSEPGRGTTVKILIPKEDTPC